jgi:dTDP-4-dehydrorhamnose reductase
VSVPRPVDGGAPPEVWAGFECTVRRVRDGYVDQLSLTGHDRRVTDLDLVAELGIRTVRYPVLWTRTAPRRLDEADWSWPDERLARLRALGIDPIVGLEHHGSGPRHTSLVEDSFATGLAAYAREVAKRYPWVRRFTPVNEPLTTARFSGLYGHWYPHGRDDTAFVRALLVQCRAIVLSMAAIREVLPHAELVQTEDVGRVFSTPRLQYQATFENERRWLSYDLLCGRVDRRHALWDYLRWAGADEASLAWFVEHPCPPDVIGVNHYLSGERFLDERLDRYPTGAHGGNGRDRYADVLAARVCARGPAGPAVILREAWGRYGLPIAVTEAHNGCTREEQLRWLHEVWQAALTVRGEGADVRAVTAWSFLGAYDWPSLLTREEGVYEPGVFDLEGPTPRPTALAGMLRDLAAGRPHPHPVLASPGWWRRRERLWYEPHDLVTGGPGDTAPGVGRAPPIVITGGAGALARAVARACRARGLPYHLLSRRDVDIADASAVAHALAAFRPWAVVNAAGFGDVDEAERDADACFRVNAIGPGVLADGCARSGVKLVTFSSGIVFDGGRADPYLEHHHAAPINAFGRAKAEGERRVLERHEAAMVIRAGSFFGNDGGTGFAPRALRTLERGEELLAPADVVTSLTYVPDLVEATLDLLVDGERGIWHLANDGAVSWFDFAAMAAERAGWDPGGIVACELADLGFRAPRPAYTVLGSRRTAAVPHLDDAIRRAMARRREGAPDPVARSVRAARANDASA